MKRLSLILAAYTSVLLNALAEPPPYPYNESQQKRFVMEMRGHDDRVLGVELVIATPAEDDLSPMEVLEKQVGLKWSGFYGGIVYRFDHRSKAWEPIMSRFMLSTKGRVGLVDGLKVRELKSGDVLLLHAPSPHLRK